MSQRPSFPVAKTGDYVNIAQNLPHEEPEVVRSNTSNLEVAYNQERISWLRHDKAPYRNYHATAADQTRLLGLNPRIFWLMIFLVTIILSIGIGAGLGVGLSSRNKNKSLSSPTSSAVPISSAVPPSNSDAKTKPSPTPLPNSNPSTTGVTCPANDTLDYTPASSSSNSNAYAVNSSTLTYTVHCGYTYDSSKDIDDIQWIPNTNLTACIDLCSIFNVQYPFGGGQYGFYGLCSGVTVIKNGTCQLKTGVEAGATNANKKGDGDSAMLVW